MNKIDFLLIFQFYLSCRALNCADPGRRMKISWAKLSMYMDKLRSTKFLENNAPDHYKKLCRRHHETELLRFGVINFAPLDYDPGPSAVLLLYRPKKCNNIFITKRSETDWESNLSTSAWSNWTLACSPYEPLNIWDMQFILSIQSFFWH